MRLFRLNCTECQEIIMTALGALDGILMAQLRGDSLVVTYDDSKVRFHEIVNSLLSVGFGAYLRRMVLSLEKHPVSDLRDWQSFEDKLKEQLDKLAIVEYDAVTKKMVLTLDTSVGEDEVFEALSKVGIGGFRVISDEVAQVTLSMS